MDQVTVKTTKRGLTIHVPNSQCAVFNWVLEEGLAGLGMIDFDDQSEPIVTSGCLDKWNGINYIWQ